MDRLFELFESVPRQGPGCAAATRRALSLLPPLPERPEVADLGCGAGTQTILLAEALPTARITAVDVHRPFLSILAARAAAAGAADRIVTAEASLDALPAPPGGADLLWAEGSLYSVGLEHALRSLLPVLRPGGCLAFTELAWFVPAPPEAARAYMARAYPAMLDVEGNVALARACGYEVLGHFLLPPEAWEENYYVPLEGAVEKLLAARPGDGEAMAVAEEVREEIAVYRECPGAYGYVFLVLRRPG